jgi:hypothetical protein
VRIFLTRAVFNAEETDPTGILTNDVSMGILKVCSLGRIDIRRTAPWDI